MAIQPETVNALLDEYMRDPNRMTSPGDVLRIERAGTTVTYHGFPPAIIEGEPVISALRLGLWVALRGWSDWVADRYGDNADEWPDDIRSRITELRKLLA